MKLGVARLCLDCDEVHDQEHCPVCASEVFSFLTRWVPRSNGRLTRTTQASPERPEVEIYRQITGLDSKKGKWRLLVGSAVGLGALGIAGWAWRRTARATQAPSSGPVTSERPSTEKPL